MQYPIYFLLALIFTSVISIACGRIDIEGALWTHQFKDVSLRISGVATDEANNVYIADRRLHKVTDGFLRKYDSRGKEIWARPFGAVGVTGMDTDGWRYTGTHVKGVATGLKSVYVLGVVKHTEKPAVYVPGRPTALLEEKRVTFVRKYDLEGNELWTVDFGTVHYTPSKNSDIIEVDSLTTDAGGNFYVVGHAMGKLPGQNISGDGYAFVCKHNAKGEELWTQRFETGLGSNCSDVATDKSRNVYVSGCARGTLPYQPDMVLSRATTHLFLKKFDVEGQELWTRQFKQEVCRSAVDLVADPAGNAYTLLTTGKSLLVHVRKYDSDGNVIWTRNVTGIGSRPNARSIAADPKGNIYVSGTSPAFVQKYDTDGNKLWTHLLGDSDKIKYRVSQAAVDSAGNVYITGEISREGGWFAYEPDGMYVKGAYLTKIGGPSQR